MDIKDLTSKLIQIRKTYSESFNIPISSDWYPIKISEEVGEMCSAYLSLTKRARPKGELPDLLTQNLADEIADVIAMTLLFAESQNIDIEKAIEDKWFKYLNRK